MVINNVGGTKLHENNPMYCDHQSKQINELIQLFHVSILGLLVYKPEYMVDLFGIRITLCRVCCDYRCVPNAILNRW